MKMMLSSLIDLPGELLSAVYLGFDLIFQFFFCVWYSLMADSFPFSLNIFTKSKKIWLAYHLIYTDQGTITL